jgi:hypothetical protein
MGIISSNLIFIYDSLAGDEVLLKSKLKPRGTRTPHKNDLDARKPVLEVSHYIPYAVILFPFSFPSLLWTGLTQQ